MTDLGSCRLKAELGGKSLNLTASFFERAGTIDFLGGEVKFFLDGKLGGDAATSFDFVVGGLAGPDELVGQGIGVEDGETHFAQHGGDGAFAAGDSTGEAESEHDRELSRRGG